MCYGRSARLTRKARRFALEPHGGGTGTRKSTLGIGDLAARTPSCARCCALPHRTRFARRSATNSSSASRADRDRVAAAVALSYANRSGRKWPEKNRTRRRGRGSAPAAKGFRPAARARHFRSK